MSVDLKSEWSTIQTHRALPPPTQKHRHKPSSSDKAVIAFRLTATVFLPNDLPWRDSALSVSQHNPTLASISGNPPPSVSRQTKGCPHYQHTCYILNAVARLLPPLWWLILVWPSPSLTQRPSLQFQLILIAGKSLCGCEQGQEP